MTLPILEDYLIDCCSSSMVACTPLIDQDLAVQSLEADDGSWSCYDDCMISIDVRTIVDTKRKTIRGIIRTFSDDYRSFMLLCEPYRGLGD